MGYFLFLFLNGTMFIRPAEIVPDLVGLPIYECLILGCMAATLPGMFGQVTQRSLAEHPITLCVLMLLPAILLSHLSHGIWWRARDGSTEFAKVVIYFLLLMANVTSLDRLRGFAAWLLGCIAVAALIAVLQYHAVINLPSLRTVYDVEIDSATGVQTLVPRICSTGIFNDPNDLAMIVVLGMVLAAYFTTDERVRVLGPVFIAAELLFAYILVLTKSRGGLMALGTAIFALLQARYGWRKALVWASPAVLGLAVLVGGRQADLGGALEGGSGQSRIQLWASGLAALRQSPIFGIGYDTYAEMAGNVAHNSFIQAFTELGIFGGAAFLGAFFYSVRSLYRLESSSIAAAGAELNRFRPYLLAGIGGFTASMLSLSRTYVLPTYLMLGMTGSYLDLVNDTRHPDDVAVTGDLIKQVIKISVVFLAASYVFVRVFARWSAG